MAVEETAPEVVDQSPEETESPVDGETPSDNDHEEGEALDDDDVSFDGSMFDPMQHLTQLFVTEDGQPVVDLVQSMQTSLQGMHASLEGILEEQTRLNKILFKLVGVLDKQAPRATKAA